MFLRIVVTNCRPRWKSSSNKAFEIAAFVVEQLSRQSPVDGENRLPVIDVSGGELHTQQFTAVIDDHMQFESVEPAHG
jgi:hypothetical protein